jgi:hypothetical protein
MPELGPYGSVLGARGNSRPYRELRLLTRRGRLLTHNGLSKPQSLGAHTVNERVISARKSALARSYRGDSDAMTDSDARSG